MTTVSATPPSRLRASEEWESLRDLEWKPVEIPPEAWQKASPEAIAIAIRAEMEALRKKGAVEHNNPTPESNDMYLPNVASLSPAHVNQLTDVVQNMIRTRADEGIVVHGGNGEQETSSLETYLSWLQQRAVADVDDGTYTPADILKTANDIG